MDLFIAILISLLAIPLVTFTDGIARAIVGVLFVLFLPGYSLISALFPAQHPPDYIERLALSVVTSIALLVLVGVVLSLTPLGIKLMPAFVFEFVCIVVFCFIAWLRRRKLVPESRFSLRDGTRDLELMLFPGGKKYGAIVLGIAVLAIAGLLGIMYAQSIASAGDEDNELYLLSADWTTAHYPRQVRAGDQVAVKVVLVNHERQPVNYILHVSTGDRDILSEGEIYLKPDETWNKEISFTAVAVGANQKVEYKLFRKDKDKPDQVLYIYIDVFNR